MSKIAYPRALATLVLCLAAILPCLGADAPAPPPAPKTPLIPRAPDMASWTITYTYKTDDAAKKAADANAPAPYVPRRIMSLAVEKTGTTYHLTATYSQGRPIQSWIVNGREVSQMPEGDLFMRSISGENYHDFSQSDFEELSWLNLKDYTGVKKRDDQQVFAFSESNNDRQLNRREQIDYHLASSVAPPLGATVKHAEALIKKAGDTYKAQEYGGTTSMVQLDASTQLPIEWDDGKVDRVYQFGPAPTDPITLPPEVAAEFKKWSDRIAGQ